MAKIAPQLPIEVDSETGVWTSDALPMLYVPRHFFVNNHMGIEEVLGADAYAEILYKAGYKSAWHWCEKEAECSSLTLAVPLSRSMSWILNRPQPRCDRRFM